MNKFKLNYAKQFQSIIKEVIGSVLLISTLLVMPIYADNDSIDEQEAIDYRNIQALKGVSEYVEDNHERFRQLRKQSQEESENILMAQPSGTYLFTREGACEDCDQDFDLSKKVVKTLNQKAPVKVKFDESDLAYDFGGTCTAMALDFLARYIEECSQLTNPADIRNKVKQFKPFYRLQTGTHMSRQGAYNAIKVNKALSQSQPDEMKYRKMQALSNYHGLILKPATKTIKINTIDNNPNSFKTQIKNLPNGTYVVRALSPAVNDKMEYYGHTMILVKGATFSVYFDNSDGAAEITNDVAGYVKDKLLSWHIPEVRLYKANCENNLCKNKSTESY